MPYEIDFIGVNKEQAAKDADAICLRWKNYDQYGNAVYKVGVVDGGFENHGKAIVRHMNRYYFNDWGGNKKPDEKVIDFMIVTHSDNDHTIGLKQVLENFSVKKIYMNIPWLYESELYDFIRDRRITPYSLTRKLREAYPHVSEIEDIAVKQGIPIYSAFQGTLIEERLRILSPTKDFYLQLLVDSDKTPLQEESSLLHQIGDSHQKMEEAAKAYAYTKYESWQDEILREDVDTTAENESSVVLYGNMDEEGFLLTGDAGIQALRIAMDYMDSIDIDIKQRVSFYQIPHHGSRRNVSPSILNRMLGDKVAKYETKRKKAFASAADSSDHPLKVVTNAYTKRGVKVYKTGANCIRHHRGEMPERNWEAATPIEFSNYVEEW